MKHFFLALKIIIPLSILFKDAICNFSKIFMHDYSSLCALRNTILIMLFFSVMHINGVFKVLTLVLGYRLIKLWQFFMTEFFYTVHITDDNCVKTRTFCHL